MIYHITTKQDWAIALQKGFYENASLATEGFIHNSTLPQLAGVLHRYYTNQKDLLVLHIEESLLSSPVKYEFAASVNEFFPHIFGPINLNAISKIEEA